MKIKNIFLIVLCSCLLFACSHKSGSGRIITSERSIEDFTGLKVAGPFEVEVRRGSAPKVTIEADDNLMKYVEVTTVAGVFNIKLDNINVNDAHLKILITAVNLNNISTSAAANVTVKDELRSSDRIQFSASSASEISSSVDGPEVKAETSSGAEINLTGTTKNFHSSASSGSTINAKELLSENSIAQASSGGSANVYASVSLNASSSSGGNITYRGSVTNIRKSESSGGEVQKED